MHVKEVAGVRVYITACSVVSYTLCIMFGDELPNDVVLAVQRILEIEVHGSTDPLDDLSSNFNPAKVLNDLFPDGTFSFSAHIPCIDILIKESHRKFSCTD